MQKFRWRLIAAHRDPYRADPAGGQLVQGMERRQVTQVVTEIAGSAERRGPLRYDHTLVRADRREKFHRLAAGPYHQPGRCGRLPGQGSHLRLKRRLGAIVARDREAFRLDQHARWRCVAQARGRRAHHRAPALGFGVDLIFIVMLHFQAIQSGQQDRSRQTGREKGNRAAGYDSDESVAPSKLLEEPGDLRERLGKRGICDDR